MNERSLKLTKIFNLNLLKFQAQSRIIKTESIPVSTRAKIYPENDFQDHTVGPKARLGVILYVWVLGGKGESKRDTA